MKNLLITGFEPFGGETTNPSWDAVCALPSEISCFKLTKLLVPVVFEKGARKIIDTANVISPDVRLCIGQAGGRSAITPELVGINLRHGSIPDNDGNKPKDDEIVIGGDKAYFSTLPVRKMVDAISATGVPSHLSYSAGAYVCNDVIYSLLSYYNGTGTKVGFIHVPYSKDQNKEPNLDINDIIKGLTAAIEAIGSEEDL
jgi:pyroglutamyl-peptidase